MSTDLALSAALRTALPSSFGGRTIAPDDAGYQAARRVWNGTVDKRPALIAVCTSSADVAAAVRAARAVDAPLSVRGGGHQVAGLSVREGGLVVDLGGLRGVRLSEDASRASAGGGCLLGDVDRACAAAGRLVPAGVVSHTGLGGLALGGGFGWTFRNFGLTCDNIIAAEVVLADGTITRAGQDDDADLLWALRGGGGNFGVVTDFELTTHPVADVLLGQAIFLLADLPRAVAHYVEVMADAPDALSAICITTTAPALPGLPDRLVGQPIVMINAVWSGDLSAGDLSAGDLSAGDLYSGEKPLRRLIDDARPVAATLERMPYIAVQTMQDDLHPHGRRNYNKSRYLDRVDDTAIAALAVAGAGLPGPHSQIEILRLGGQAARVAADATCFAHRDAAYILNVVAAWTDVARTGEHIAWARGTYDAFDPVGSNAGYINFLDAESDRVRSVYPGRTYGRLQSIKRRLDPDQVFTGNVPIEPAAPAAPAAPGGLRGGLDGAGLGRRAG
jgi:FAD/FMN-containing dehydrogenase